MNRKEIFTVFFYFILHYAVLFDILLCCIFVSSVIFSVLSCCIALLFHCCMRFVAL